MLSLLIALASMIPPADEGIELVVVPAPGRDVVDSHEALEVQPRFPLRVMVMFTDYPIPGYHPSQIAHHGQQSLEKSALPSPRRAH